MSPAATRMLHALLGIAGIGLGVLAYRAQVDNLPEPLTTTGRATATVLAGWSFLVAGLVAWRRRPDNRLGPLMVAAAFALLARQLRYGDGELAFTLFTLFGEVAYVLVGHCALAYPSGRVTDRLERLWLGVAYPVAVLFPLALLLVYDGSLRLQYFPAARESLLVVWGSGDATRVVQKSYAVAAYGVLAGLFVVLVLRKLVRATPRTRRILAPLLIAAALGALRAVLDSIFAFASSPPSIAYDLFWWQVFALIALPLALLVGLLRARLARVHVSELVVQLEQVPAEGIRDELADALHDPTLELGLWLPERLEYVDAAGRSLVPEEGPTRAVTKIEHEGEPLAVLVHDPSLSDEPKLLEGVAAAARLALVNARLHAEVRAQLETVRESRARIVSAADEERRRIERDLHDGAQQRLVALALELRSAQRSLSGEASPELEQLLESTADELQVAVEELRSLAHGIHPGTLTQAGLASALSELASRMPLPVTVDVLGERLSPEVEATAYFVASEALANVVKHARATRATVRAVRENRTLVVEVADDGRGGALLDGGSGLRGLVDRVESRGGRLRIESGGSGTRVVGEIPCAS
jgi:signal transduction histidine kinase